MKSVEINCLTQLENIDFSKVVLDEINDREITFFTNHIWIECFSESIIIYGVKEEYYKEKDFEILSITSINVMEDIDNEVKYILDSDIEKKIVELLNKEFCNQLEVEYFN